MMCKRPFIGVLAVIAVLSFSAQLAGAQGVTTGGLTGNVTDEIIQQYIESHKDLPDEHNDNFQIDE